MQIRHVGIVTQNIEAEKKFYLGCGLKELSDTAEQVRIVKLQDKRGMVLELLQYESMSESVLRSKGISHIAFTRDADDNYMEVVTTCPG